MTRSGNAVFPPQVTREMDDENQIDDEFQDGPEEQADTSVALDRPKPNYGAPIYGPEHYNYGRLSEPRTDIPPLNDPARLLGASVRGRAMPRGNDILARAPQLPRVATARTEREAEAAFRRGEADAMKQLRAEQTARNEQAKVDRDTENSRRLANFKGTGAAYYKDPLTGLLTQSVDSATKRPLFNQSAWEPTKNAKTGIPGYRRRNRFGEEEFRAAPVVFADDPNDDFGYYRIPETGEQIAAGRIGELVNHKDIAIAKAARAANTRRVNEQWKAALEPRVLARNIADEEFKAAQMSRDEIGQQIVSLEQQIGMAADPVAAQGMQATIDSLMQQRDAINDRLKPRRGDLAVARDRAMREHAIFSKKAMVEKYRAQRGEIEANIREHGETPALKEALRSNDQQQAIFEESLGADIREFLPAVAQRLQRQDAKTEALTQNEPSALLQRGLKTIGSLPLTQLAKRFGNFPVGEVPPGAVLKVAQRRDEIGQMLENNPENLSPEVLQNLQAEQTYLTQLYDQRFARLSPEARTQLTEFIDAQTTTAAGAAARGAASTVAGGVGALVGAKGGAAVGALGGPAAPFTVPAGTIIGGLLGAIFADKGARKLAEKTMPETYAKFQDYSAKDWEQHTMATFGGQVAGNAAMFRLNLKPSDMATTGRAVEKLATGKVLTDAERKAANALAVQAGIAGASAVALPLIDGQPIESDQVLAAAAQMLLFGQARGPLAKLGPTGGQPRPPSPEQPPGGGSVPVTPDRPTGEPAGAPLTPDEVKTASADEITRAMLTPAQQSAAAFMDTPGEAAFRQQPEAGKLLRRELRSEADRAEQAAMAAEAARMRGPAERSAEVFTSAEDQRVRQSTGSGEALRRELAEEERLNPPVERGFNPPEPTAIQRQIEQQTGVAGRVGTSAETSAQVLSGEMPARQASESARVFTETQAEPPQTTRTPPPQPESVEYLGKRYLVAEGVGEPVDQWQVKMPGDERGRTMTREQLAAEGFDTSNLPAATAKPEGPTNADSQQSAATLPVREPPGDGETVGRGNAVVQETTRAQEAVAKEAPRPEAVRQEVTDPVGKRAAERARERELARTAAKETETLFVRKRTDGLVSLEDSKKNALGSFKTADEATKWATENGYRVADQTGKRTKFTEAKEQREPLAPPQTFKQTRTELLGQIDAALKTAPLSDDFREQAVRESLKRKGYRQPTNADMRKQERDWVDQRAEELAAESSKTPIVEVKSGNSRFRIRNTREALERLRRLVEQKIGPETDPVPSPETHSQKYVIESYQGAKTEAERRGWIDQMTDETLKKLGLDKDYVRTGPGRVYTKEAAAELARLKAGEKPTKGEIEASTPEEFHGDLQRRIRDSIEKMPRSDYAKGDKVYTKGGTAVTFVSDTVSNRDGRPRVIVRNDDTGEKWSTFREWITPEMPAREDALRFMAERSVDQADFERHAKRKGYDDPEELNRIWNSRTEASSGESALLPKTVDKGSPRAFKFRDATTEEIGQTKVRDLAAFERSINTERLLNGERPIRLVAQTPDEAYRGIEAAGEVAAGGVRGAGPGGIERIHRALETALGKRIIFFKTSEKMPGRAMTSPELSNTIGINVDADQPFMALVGHEVGHNVRNQRPDLYKPFADAVTETNPMPDDYRALKRRQGYSDEETKTEWTNDILGARFDEPEFWQAVSERMTTTQQRGAFRQLVTVARDWLTKLVDRVKTLLHSKTAPGLTKELERIRGAAAEMLARYQAEGPHAESVSRLEMSQPEMKESKLTESLKKAGAPVDPIDYEVRRQFERQREAVDFIKQNGVAKAEAAISDPAIKGDTRVAIGGQLIKDKMLAMKNTGANVAALTRDIQRITEKMQPQLATEAGQQIAMFSQIYKDIRTAAAMTYVRDASKRRFDRMGGKRASDAAGEAAEILNDGKMTQEQKNAAIDKLKERYSETPVRRMLDELKRAETVKKLNELGALTRDDLVEVAGNALGMPNIEQAKLKHLNEIADRIENAKTPAEKARAEMELADTLALYRGFNALDLEASILTLNILSGPTTQMANFQGNLLNSIAQLGTTAIANPTKIGPMVSGLIDGMGLGASEAKAILKTGRGTRDFQDKTSRATAPLSLVDYASEFPSLNKTAANVLTKRARLVEKIGRFMKAVDAVFYYPAREAYARLAATKLLEGQFSGAELDRMVRSHLKITPEDFASATNQARAEGWEGVDLGRRTAEIIEERRKSDSPEGREATEQAERFAAEATYNQEPEGLAGVVYRHAASLVDDFRVAGAPVLKPWLMFLRVPANVFNATTNFTPAGALRAKFGMKGADGDTRNFNRDEQTRLYLQSIIGSALMGGLIWRVMKKDDVEITAAGPANAGDRAQLRKSGWEPYSIKVGNRYVSYKDSPLLVPLSIVGNVADAVRFNKAKQDMLLESKVANAVAQAPHVIFQTSMLSGMADLMNSLGSREGNLNSIGRTLGSIPANLAIPYNRLLQQVDQVFEPRQFEANPLRRSVPFVRRTDELRRDVQGRPETYDPFRRFGSEESADKVDSLLREKRVFIPDVSRSQRIGDKPMAEEDVKFLRTFSGQRIRTRLLGMSSRLRAMTREVAQKEIDKVSREEREKAKEMISRRLRSRPQLSHATKK